MRGPKVQNNGLTAFTLPKLSISKTVRSMKIRTLPSHPFCQKEGVPGCSQETEREKNKKCCIPRENENPVAMVTGGKNT